MEVTTAGWWCSLLVWSQTLATTSILIDQSTAGGHGRMVVVSDREARRGWGPDFTSGWEQKHLWWSLLSSFIMIIYSFNLICQINVVAFVGLAVLVLAYVTHLVHIMQRVQKNREERQQKVLISNFTQFVRFCSILCGNFCVFLSRQLSLHQNILVVYHLHLHQAQRVQRQRRKRLTTSAFYTSLMKVLSSIHQHRS